MDKLKPLFTFKINGITFGFTANIIIQWVIIAIIAVLCFFLTSNLKKIPGKKQNIAEMFVEFINNLVKSNLGEQYLGIVPYTAALILFLIMMNLTGLVGIKAPTADYSVTLGMALTTFIAIQGYAIKKKGLRHYFTAYAEPAAFLLPLNIIDRLIIVVSLSLRLYGNIVAGVVIVEMCYSGRGLARFAQIGLPLVAHGYFDVFEGAIQMVVFMMLSVINLKVIAEE